MVGTQFLFDRFPDLRLDAHQLAASCRLVIPEHHTDVLQLQIVEVIELHHKPVLGFERFDRMF